MRMTREELEELSSKELHDLAMESARRRLDLGFLWNLAKEIPVAEAASGHLAEAGNDVTRVSALLTDIVSSGKGDLADALRPFYIDYLEH